MELTSKLKKVEITESDASSEYVSVKLTIEGTAATPEQCRELSQMVGKALVVGIDLLQAEIPTGSSRGPSKNGASLFDGLSKN